LLCLASLFLVMFFRPSCVWLHFISSSSSYLLCLFSLAWLPVCSLARSSSVSPPGGFARVFSFVCGVSSVAFGCTFACVS
jgi:hypothetical protein